MGESINSPDNNSHSWITKDGLSLYITTTRFSHSDTDQDIAVSQRRSVNDPWGTPVRLGPNVNTVGYNDAVPSISEDGLDLYFNSPRPHPTGCGAADLYVSHRTDPSDDFGWQPSVNMGCVVNSSGPDNAPDFFQADGTDYLYYLQTEPPGGIGTLPNIVVNTRPTGKADWGSPVPVNELNSKYQQGRMSIRRTDGLEILFTSPRPGIGTVDIWVSTRESLSSPWSPPANLGPPINIPDNEDAAPNLDFEGTTMYFYSSTRPGFDGRDLYTSTRERFCAIFITIDFPGARLTGARGINARGDIVGGYDDAAGVTHGYLLHRAEFSSFDFPESVHTRAWDINPAREIVGTYIDVAGRTHAFLRNGDAFNTIDFPDSISTQGFGINRLRDIVGAYNDISGIAHGYLLAGGRFTAIDFPGARSTGSAAHINSRRDIVGQYDDFDGRRHGYLRRRGEFTSIDFPGAAITRGRGINARGDIVGRYDNPDGTIHGYLLNRHGVFTSIDVPGARLTEAYRINAGGDIVGEYVSTDGSTHGFLLTNGEQTKDIEIEDR